MNRLDETIVFLQSYPTWVTWLIALWLLCTAALVASLLLVERRAAVSREVSIDAFRQVHISEEGIGLELVMRNALDRTAQLVELQLAFYGAQKPTAGLQSLAIEPAVYYMREGSDGSLEVRERGSERRHDVDVRYPLTNQRYAEVRIPLARPLRREETDTFIVVILTDLLPAPSHENAEARIKYNGDQLTRERTMTLPH